MFYKFLAILAILPGCYCTFRFIDVVVPMKHPVRFAVTGTVLSGALWCINNMLLPRPSFLVEFITALVGILVVLMLLPRKDFFKAALVHVVFQGTQSMLVMVLLTAADRLLGLDITMLVRTGTLQYVWMCLFVSAASVPVLYGVARLLRRAMPIIRSGTRYVWFLIIPFTQMTLLSLASRPVIDIEYYVGYKATLVFCILMSVAADTACIVIYRKLREIDCMEMVAEQSKKALDAQVSYFQELQNQILAVNRIRHDLNNQLQAARYLLEQGDREQVSRQLDQLQGAIREHVGTRYSENPVVDAVVSVKAEQCQKLGIRLETGILLPGDLEIENAHLCSVFSNLLDNSIHGIQEAGLKDAAIQLRSDVHGGFLTVTCINPAVEREKKKSLDVLRRHGLGLDILEHIAKQYEGRVDSGFRDGRYTTVVFLKLRS